MTKHIPFRSYAFVLALLYGLITLVSLFQIARIIFYRHNLFHYQFGFLAYCFIWGILRSVFWLFVPWSTFYELLLQGAGLVVQFSTFSFLVLFYVQIVFKSRDQWADFRTLIIALYITINFIFLAGYIAQVCLQSIQIDPSPVADFFCAIMFIILSGFLAFFGSQVIIIVANEAVKVNFLRHKIQLSILTVLLVLIFVSRAVKDFLSGFDIGTSNISNNPEEDTIGQQSLFFSLMVVWDLIPATMVIGLFWHIPDAHTIETNFPEVVHRPVIVEGDLDDSLHIQSELLPPDNVKWPITRPINEDTEHEGPSYAYEWKRKRGYKKFAGYNTRSPLLTGTSFAEDGPTESDRTDVIHSENY